MALEFDNTYRNKASLVVSKLYEGGTLEIQDSSNTTLATINIPQDAFSNQGSGSAGLSDELTASVSESGTAAKYIATLDGGGTESGTITVTGSGGDMEMDDVELVKGGIAKITTWTNIWPASA